MMESESEGMNEGKHTQKTEPFAEERERERIPKSKFYINKVAGVSNAVLFSFRWYCEMLAKPIRTRQARALMTSRCFSGMRHGHWTIST